MALEQTQLQELQAQLENKKVQLEQELNRIATPTGTPGEYKTRFEDFGREDGDSESETQQYVDTIGVEDTLEQQLAAVTDALMRIQDGSYGKCGKCGMDIDPERLRAYPAAKMCIQHA